MMKCFSTLILVLSVFSSCSLLLTENEETGMDPATNLRNPDDFVTDDIEDSVKNIDLEKTEDPIELVPCALGDYPESVRANRFLNNNNCYVYFDESKSWNDAKAFCENISSQHQSHMVTITYNAELRFIENRGYPNSFWVGYQDNDNNDGDFAFITNETNTLTSTPWFVPVVGDTFGEQPNNVGDNEWCTEHRLIAGNPESTHHNTWWDRTCSDSYPSIVTLCEVEN